MVLFFYDSNILDFILFHVFSLLINFFDLQSGRLKRANFLWGSFQNWERAEPKNLKTKKR